MHITNRSDNKTHVFEFRDPDHIPEAGDVYVALTTFITRGNKVYHVGDKFHVICRTPLIPYGEITSRGNLVVRDNDEKLTIWSTFECCITRGLLELENSNG